MLRAQASFRQLFRVLPNFRLLYSPRDHCMCLYTSETSQNIFPEKKNESLRSQFCFCNFLHFQYILVVLRQYFLRASNPYQKFISKPHLQRAGVKFFQSDEEEDEEDSDEPEAVITVPPVVKVDKECWTHEPEFDKYVFHLSVHLLTMKISQRAHENCCSCREKPFNICSCSSCVSVSNWGSQK